MATRSVQERVLRRHVFRRHRHLHFGAYLDVDYYDLREREYPLLAPNALAERLRKIAEIFPPNPGFEFNVFYRRRS